MKVVRLALLLTLPVLAAALPARAGTVSDLTVSDAVAKCESWIKTRHSGDTPTVHSVDADTLCVDTNNVGLTADLAKDFANKISAMSPDHAPQIVIRSLGGDVRYGIAMGDALVGRRATVFVSTFCGSSCANYIFLAAHERYILHDSVVFFHGGINSAVIDSWVQTQSGPAPTRQRKAETRKRIEADFARQRKLLVRGGIDPDFFEWMERLNHDTALFSQKCPGKEQIRLLVFSDEFLKSIGAQVIMNDGPQSQDNLDRVLERYGLAQTTCFWS